MAKAKETTGREPEEMKLSKAYHDLITIKRKENKKNGVRWSQENATRIMSECYKQVYGE